MKKSILELQKVKEALLLEKAEEAEVFRKIAMEKTLEQRVKEGASWFPLNVISSGFGLGSYPYAIVERTKQLDTPHKFRAGQVVTVFSQSGREQKEPFSDAKGIVNYVERNKMRITFYDEDFPDWIDNGRLGVDLASDERSYREMEAALNHVMAAEKGRVAELREILLGYAPMHILDDRDAESVEIPRLNHAQNMALRAVLKSQDVCVIHGPPGTGKTTTLVQVIQQLSKREKNILVCAPSNAAVDLLAGQLSKSGLNVLRIGNVSRVGDDIYGLTLDGKLSDRPEMNEVKKMKLEAAQLFKKAGKWRRSFDSDAREERKATYMEAKAITTHAKMLEDYTVQKLIMEAEVVCCTLVGANDSYIEKLKFQTVVIDEAAQALEPATWIPILKAERVVFAGDPFQLPPTVKSNAASKLGLAETLMEKCLKRLAHNNLLDTQYRMNEQIMGFSNLMFYDNQLKAFEGVAKHFLQFNYCETPPKGGTITAPVEFIDTAGCGYEEKINPQTLSRYNEDEYGILRMHLDDLLVRTREYPLSIGIISPYKDQVNYIQQNMRTDFDHFPEANVTIDTIDSFQGQERDVIYISLVRSNDKGEIGFLSDSRRMNVAMTRARKKLVIIGDSATLGGHQFYQKFLDYCERVGGYYTAWEWV